MIEAIAPQVNTILLLIVIGLQIHLIVRRNGSGRLDPADWEKRIKNVCRSAIREERAGLPFVDAP